MENKEKINIDLLDDFKNHPYKIIDDSNFWLLKQSLSQSGVLVPLIVRQKDDGRYEIISGHRRKKACEELGIKEVPCIVRDLSDEQAIISMVDSNCQREMILPSEKAFAYKMKLEAIKKLGIQSPLETEQDSRAQIYRYIRLTNLIPELLQLVDDTVLKDKRSNLTMGLRPAVEISYLTEDEQLMLYDQILYTDSTPSYNQAINLKDLSRLNKLNLDVIKMIMNEPKPNQEKMLSFNEKRIREVLPSNVKDYNMEEFIIKAIENYSKTLALERGDTDDLEI